nr:hypothetical protein [Brevundimonas sp. C43]
MLKPIWTTTPETASRTRGRIERVLNAKRAAGNRTCENPARWKGHLSTLFPKRQKLTKDHHRAMPFQEIGDFIPLLRSRPALSAQELEFTILTAAWTNEVPGARRAEFDTARRLEGAGRAHEAGRRSQGALIRARRRPAGARLRRDAGSCWAGVFADAKGDQLSDAAMSRLLKVRKGFSAYSVHGFRSTFRDWAGGATTFPEAAAEAALSHQVSSEVERAYKWGDVLEKRRKMMEA